jgi:hypothetical protein
MSQRRLARFSGVFEEFSSVDENKPRRIYSSFLIRYWRFRNEQQTEHSYFEIEHIQSGARQRVSKLADALPWMEEAAETKPPVINDED